MRLKDYKENLEKNSLGVERINVAKGEPLPLSLFLNSNNNILPSNLIFEETRNGSNEVIYSWKSEEGLIIEKKHLFNPHDYKINVEISLLNQSDKALTTSLSIDLFENDSEKGDRYNFIGQSVKLPEDIDRKSFEDIDATTYSLDGDIKWLATENKYFITALIPKYDGVKHVSARRIGENLISSSFEHRDISLSAGETKSFSYTFYSGPKDLYILKEMGVGLEGAIDMGWFHALAEPLLRFLKFIYSYTGNYGYAIILVTLIIKVVFFPLSNKSYKSMKGMQKLQPLMNELKEKHKGNKDQMGREVMALYKKHKVNPFSGCLPMVLQIPVFIALYNVLLSAIELRHAPFHFWILDMSTKDPYYVTPVIMGLTMFLQQKMTPTTPDPMQQKVMMMMPFIFTFMFMNLPSGLVLYWVVNNVLSIGQQYYILKKT